MKRLFTKKTIKEKNEINIIYKDDNKAGERRATKAEEKNEEKPK